MFEYFWVFWVFLSIFGYFGYFGHIQCRQGRHGRQGILMSRQVNVCYCKTEHATVGLLGLLSLQQGFFIESLCSCEAHL